MHVPQSLQTHHEIRSLAAVPLHIVSPRHSKPIVTIVQDVALGVYRITQNHVRLTRRQLMNLMASNAEYRDLPAPQEVDGLASRWSGRQALSTVLPRGVNATLKNKDMEDRGCPQSDYAVVIRDGRLESGVLSANEYTEPSRGLVHSIYNDRGPLALTTFLNNTQKIICDWLVLSGFSVGISDLATSSAIEDKLRAKVHDMKKAVFQKVHDVQTGKFENASTKNNDEFFESQVTNLLYKGHKEMEKIGMSCFDTQANRMLNMIQSGSKGGAVNFTQMVACVGQQTIDNGRVPDGFEHRTLPHFTKFDDGPESRGFVEHSFIMGLTPQEFFFHSMGGRIGLIDTAVKSVTGDTPIVIIEDGRPKRVLIGAWIDAKLDAPGARDRTKLFGPEDRNMELLELQATSTFIPTIDERGVASWGELTAVTRHDPGERLYRVVTASGRSVTVAESKTLLVWQPESQEFVETDSRLVKVGDSVPVALNLPDPPVEVVAIDADLDFESGLRVGTRLRLAAPDDAAEAVVPDVAFSGPKEFARGIVRGYFSGYFSGYVAGRQQVPPRLAEGLCLLCARFDGFVKLHSSDGGTELLFDVDAVDVNRVNDVALDAIVSIDVFGPDKHPKLYDVTVPSTLNFVVANGLCLNDTSETGYIQRKLVKAMEDCKVHHDLSVRNAAGHIVQFLYGDDGMDPIKLEYQHLTTVGLEIPRILESHVIADAALELRHVVNDDILKELAGDSLFRARMTAFYEQLLDDRRYLVCRVHNREKSDLIVFPVHIQRIVENASFTVAKYGMTFASDLDPRHVLDTIDVLARELRPRPTADKVGARKEAYDDGHFLPMLLRCLLSPKVLLLKYRLNRLAFDRVVQQIRTAFHRALAQPGDMVGIVAAQSIGEPTTQMSVHYASKGVIVSSTGGVFNGSVGEYVDRILARLGDRAVAVGPGSVVLDLPAGEDHFIVGVSDREATSWRRISQVSRHPSNGGLVRVITRTGRATTATLSHSFLKRVESGIEPVLGADLRVGDRVPVAKRIPAVQGALASIRIGETEYQLTKDLGRFFGAYVADGSVSGNVVSISKVIPEYQDKLRSVVECVFGIPMVVIVDEVDVDDTSKYPGAARLTFDSQDHAQFLLNNFATGSFDKYLPGWVFASNLDFVRGVLQGYFDGLTVTALPAGTGIAIDSTDSLSIRSGSVSERLTEDMLLLLAYTGICGSKRKETCTDGVVHTIRIARRYAQQFKDEIGFVARDKAEGLDSIIIAEHSHHDALEQHSTKEDLEMIPALGDAIAAVVEALQLPDQSRPCQEKEAIGRETLKSCIAVFEAALAEQRTEMEARHAETARKTDTLRAFLQRAASRANARGVIDLPEDMGRLVADVGKAFFPRGSFSQYDKLKAIERATLQSFIDQFEPANEARLLADRARIAPVADKIGILRQAAYSDVVWDEIVELERLPDPQECVYDFTVPGNDSFMVDCGVLVHNTLNTFHLSGVANKGMQGVPRLKELMSVSKNIKTPRMEVFLRKPHGASLEAAKLVANDLQTTRFRDLVQRTRIYYDPNDLDTQIADDTELLKFHEQFSALVAASSSELQKSPWLLRFEFDRAKMLDLGVTMLDLEHVLLDWFDDTLSCTMSDDNAKSLVGRVRLNVSPDEDTQDMLTELKALEQSILEKVVIKGIPLVHRAAVDQDTFALLVYDDHTDTFVKRDEIRVSTNGGNLVRVLAHESVDSFRTTTNDVNEVYEVLGIEAARSALLNELLAVMCYDNKNNVNYRHLALLVDVMTNRGNLQSIDRHGINRGEIGPLAKCSFEETTDMLVKAGMFSELDRINGVSANIMLGQVAPCGTGDCEIILDTSLVAQFGAEIPLPDDAKHFNKIVQPQATSSKAKPHMPEFVAPSADERTREKQADEIEIV